LVTCSITARSVRQTPSRLTASVRSTCSIGAVASAPVKEMPALAIATSIAPKRSTVALPIPRAAPVMNTVRPLTS
jgi:hypothetical protein